MTAEKNIAHNAKLVVISMLNESNQHPNKRRRHPSDKINYIE